MTALLLLLATKPVLLLLAWGVLRGRTPRVHDDVILATAVRPGHVIGLGPGFGLKVDRIVFDGDDGLLAGRIQADGPVDGRHGPLRPNQPYATVVAADSELRWL